MKIYIILYRKKFPKKKQTFKKGEEGDRMEVTKLREKMNAKKKIEVTYRQLCELIDEPEIELIY